MYNFDIPDSFSITDAFAALEEAEWIRLLRADGISVEPEKMDETDKTMCRNNFKKESTGFYRISYDDKLDILIRGAVFTFEDNSIEFIIATKRCGRPGMSFSSTSEQVLALLSNPSYLEQAGGDKNKIMESVILNVCLRGRKSPVKEFIDGYNS